MKQMKRYFKESLRDYSIHSTDFQQSHSDRNFITKNI